jgi:hypothetical protein
MDEILGSPQERLRNDGWNAPHTQPYMIGPPTWVYQPPWAIAPSARRYFRADAAARGVVP